MRKSCGATGEGRAVHENGWLKRVTLKLERVAPSRTLRLPGSSRREIAVCRVGATRTCRVPVGHSVRPGSGDCTTDR
jgi:hypothetical protein